MCILKCYQTKKFRSSMRFMKQIFNNFNTNLTSGELSTIFLDKNIDWIVRVFNKYCVVEHKVIKIKIDR